MGKEFSRDTFLTELKSILQEMPEEYFEEKTTAQAVALVIKKANITDLLLKELDAQHIFSLKQLYTAKPKKVIAYYPYETKSIRGENNEIRRFKDDYAELFSNLRTELYEMYKKENPNHLYDNKVVYVYELENSRHIAVMFKDNSVVFGNTWNISNYHF